MAIDILLILCAIAGFWLGYTKGIVATLFSVLEYVLAVLITIGFSPYFSGFLMRAFDLNQILALVISSLIFFLTSIFLLKWLIRKIENSLKKGKLSGSTKIIGGIVMLLFSILLYTIVLSMLNFNGMINEKIKLASCSYQSLKPIHQVFSSLVTDLKPVFQRYWQLIQGSVNDPKTLPSG